MDQGHFIIGERRVPYAIRRSKRRRRTIGLMIGRDGDIRILAPWRAGFGAIERLVYRQQGWLLRRLNDFTREQCFSASPRFTDGERVLYRGENLTLRLTNDTGKPQGCVAEDNILRVNLHDTAQPEDVRLELLLWYKKEARRVFKERIDHWGAALNLRYRSFAVSNPKRLWGSCSGRNDIRIAWRLIMAPPELLDYVIVHELCHIQHKNHSRRFWRAVETAMPGCKGLRKQLHALGAHLVI